ncbi:hypothetical protein D3C71_1352080 [compost metagenome]
MQANPGRYFAKRQGKNGLRQIGDEEQGRKRGTAMGHRRFLRDERKSPEQQKAIGCAARELRQDVEHQRLFLRGKRKRCN